MSEASGQSEIRKISIVVPVYNEAENIETLVSEISPLEIRGLDVEIIIVDDGSTDDTWRILMECRRKCSAVRPVRHTVNMGQSAAMLTGIHSSSGDVIVTMDGDLQNNPADIPRLLDALEGCDVVCGYRFKRRDSLSRRWASKIANWARNRITRDGVRDTGCSLKAFRRSCIGDLPMLDGVHRFMPAYFALAGRRITEIPVDHRPRSRGESKYGNLSRLPRTVLDLIGFAWYRRRLIRPVKIERG